MTIANGDYRNIEEKTVAALLADDVSGGLMESGDPAVALVRAGDLSLCRSLGSADYPAILVRATAKSETPAGAAYSVTKIFRVMASVLARAMDRSVAEEAARKIAARVEKVLREQTATDRQFLGLPDLIDGAEGVLVCLVRETRFLETDCKADRVTAQAVIEAEIQLPCAFRYE